MLSYLFFISTPSNAMEIKDITVSLSQRNEFRTILEQHYPLGEAVPHIKGLQYQKPVWKTILENKSACNTLLALTSALELSLESKVINAVFIGTPGMIECAKDYISNDPSAKQPLINMLVDTGSWVNTTWKNQSIDVAHAIIQVIGDPNVCNEKGQTVLSNAAKYGNTDLVDFLIKQNASLDNTTALIEAAQNGHSAIVQALLRAGISPTIHNEDGETALVSVRKILEKMNTYKEIAVVLSVSEKIYALSDTQ